MCGARVSIDIRSNRLMRYTRTHLTILRYVRVMECGGGGKGGGYALMKTRFIRLSGGARALCQQPLHGCSRSCARSPDQYLFYFAPRARARGWWRMTGMICVTCVASVSHTDGWLHNNMFIFYAIRTCARRSRASHE